MMHWMGRAAISALLALGGAQAGADEVATPKHTIDYDLTIAGVSIGDAQMYLDPWTMGFYHVDFSGAFRFLFWSGEATASSLGYVNGDAPHPRLYEATFKGMSDPVVIKTAFEGQRPTKWSITPPPDKKYLIDRISIDEAHLTGALDPLSALVIRAETAAAACARTLPVFTGGTRFDLVLSPGKEIAPGVFGCDVRYVPVSGHRKDSESVARMVKTGPVLSIFEVAKGLWVPHRVGMPTSVGTLAITRVIPETAK